MGPRNAYVEVVDVVVEKGGVGGETQRPWGHVGNKSSARTLARGRLHLEVTLGSATSWDRPVDRCYLVRMCRDDLAVVIGWGLSHSSAESLAERVAELLGLESPAHERPGA
jgi:hypothetical protein